MAEHRLALVLQGILAAVLASTAAGTLLLAYVIIKLTPLVASLVQQLKVLNSNNQKLHHTLERVSSDLRPKAAGLVDDRNIG